jgi:uncharacterized protein (DUF1330 family)
MQLRDQSDHWSTIQMVDTSGSSDSSVSEFGTNDTSKAFARKKNRKRTSKESQSNHINDDIFLTDTSEINFTDPSVFNLAEDPADTATAEDYGDQKLPSTSRSVLGPYDVICGRNKTAFNNIGNRRFRFTIALNLPQFVNAKSRKDKSSVIEKIKEVVHQSGGKFLMMQDEQQELTGDDTPVVWTELNTKQTHLKIGHALRDAERKMIKSQKQQQQLLRQQEQKQRQSEPIDPYHAAANNHWLSTGTTEPLLLHHSGLWDQDDYDIGSISSFSLIGDGNISSPHFPSHVPHQLHVPDPSRRYSSTGTITFTNTLPAIDHNSFQQNYISNLLQRRQRQLVNIQQQLTLLQQAQTFYPNPTLMCDGQRQLHRTLAFQNYASQSMTMNDSNVNVQNSWPENRYLNGYQAPEPIAPPILVARNSTESEMMHNVYHRSPAATSLSVPTTSEYNNVHQHLPNAHINDDFHHDITPPTTLARNTTEGITNTDHRRSGEATTAVSQSQNPTTASEHHLLDDHNVNDDLHQDITSWLLDDSEDTMDETISKILGV